MDLADHVDVSAAIFVGAEDAIAGPRAAVAMKAVAVAQADQPRVAVTAAETVAVVVETAIRPDCRCSEIC
jgi:hypothetical protein